MNYYAFTKLKSEKYLINNKKHINYCIGRIFSYSSHLQKRDYFIPNIISKLKNKRKSLIINNVNHYRDFLPIEDVAKAILILNKFKSEGIFNICSSQKILLSDIVTLLNFKNKKIKFITKDIVNDKMNYFTRADFILIRHVFIHLKNKNIKKIINKIKKKNLSFWA